MNKDYIMLRIERWILPVLIALIPFAPTVVDYFTEPDIHYIYETDFKENPMEYWDRQMDRLLKQIEEKGFTEDDEPPTFTPA